MNKCPCFSVNMKCTDLCDCKSCFNVFTDEDTETEDHDYENFDDHDDCNDKENLLNNDDI